MFFRKNQHIVQIDSHQIWLERQLEADGTTLNLKNGYG